MSDNPNMKHPYDNISEKERRSLANQEETSKQGDGKRGLTVV